MLDVQGRSRVGMKRREFIILLGGGATAWCSMVRSQQPSKVRHIAIVHASEPVATLTDPTAQPAIAAFVDELRQLGYVEGANLVIARHSGEGNSERRADVARDAVRGAPEVIFCNWGRAGSG